MITLLVSVATLLAVFLTIVLVGFVAEHTVFRRRWATSDRLVALTFEQEDADCVSIFKNTSELATGRESLSRKLSTDLQRLLHCTGVDCRLSTLLTICIAGSLVCGSIASFISVYAALPAASFGLAAPIVVLIARRNARDKKLTKQLPEVFRLISRSVRSGQTVTASLKMIADDFPAPVAEEFAECYEQQNRGIGKEMAFRKLAERTGIMELQLFVVALIVQSKSGGDLANLLDNLSEMVEKRFRLENRVKSMTAEGRVQAVVLLVLPFIAFAAVYTLAPDYASVLIAHPHLLAVTAAVQLIGTAWIYRIINFQY